MIIGGLHIILVEFLELLSISASGAADVTSQSITNIGFVTALGGVYCR